MVSDVKAYLMGMAFTAVLRCVLMVIEVMDRCMAKPRARITMDVCMSVTDIEESIVVTDNLFINLLQ